MNRVLQGERAPDGFALATGSLDLQDGLLDQLTNYLNINPGCGLVVIDTLQRVRRTTGKAINAYQADYKDVGILQKFASEREICIVLVHHLRKMKRRDRPLCPDQRHQRHLRRGGFCLRDDPRPPRGRHDQTLGDRPRPGGI